MPRRTRVIIDNVYYHVISRGNDKQIVFKEYTKWKIRNRVGTLRSPDREDRRDTVRYKIDCYL